MVERMTRHFVMTLGKTSPHTSKLLRARSVQAQLKHIKSCEAHGWGSLSLSLETSSNTQSGYLGLIQACLILLHFIKAKCAISDDIAGQQRASTSVTSALYICTKAGCIAPGAKETAQD